MVGLGTDFLYYPISDRGFWFGVGAEYASGISISITLNGLPIPTFSADLAAYLTAYGSVGWDFSAGSFVLTPAARIGNVFTTTPNMLLYEIIGFVGYRL
jgi:hypothetical protein